MATKTFRLGETLRGAVCVEYAKGFVPRDGDTARSALEMLGNFAQLEGRRRYQGHLDTLAIFVIVHDVIHDKCLELRESHSPKDRPLGSPGSFQEADEHQRFTNSPHQNAKRSAKSNAKNIFKSAATPSTALTGPKAGA